ncbi:MAG TPA: hypothetical protein PKC69_09350 [Chitinophagaceae bacterium]|mgnify:CR=1 FL=1|nr:hypothetical protein [Chitinophagaceae bacterium]
MKFRWTLLVLIAVALLIAWRTRPGADDFKKWFNAAAKTQTPPLIEETNSYLYSIYTVSFIEIKKIPGQQEAAVAVPVRKEKYLGLFGRFWKL